MLLVHEHFGRGATVWTDLVGGSQDEGGDECNLRPGLTLFVHDGTFWMKCLEYNTGEQATAIVIWEEHK